MPVESGLEDGLFGIQAVEEGGKNGLEVIGLSERFPQDQAKELDRLFTAKPLRCVSLETVVPDHPGRVRNPVLVGLQRSVHAETKTWAERKDYPGLSRELLKVSDAMHSLAIFNSHLRLCVDSTLDE